MSTPNEPPAQTGLSGTQAVEQAEQQAAETAGRNIPSFPAGPLGEDTANLRQGPDLHEGLLALLPLVGVWEGEGVANYRELADYDPALHLNESGDFSFGQQLIVSHEGENYLRWESRIWRRDPQGNPLGPDVRELGFWRITADDQIDVTLTTSTGLCEVYVGAPLNERSWEIKGDVTMSAPGRLQLGRATRIYGLVEGTDLGWVEERENSTGDALYPRMSARLHRVIG